MAPAKAPSDADWQRLAGSVGGRVLRPGDRGFHSSSAPFNKRHTRDVPAGVLAAADVADVRRAVDWARETGTRIVPRGGGHSYAGYSAVGSGLVVDLRALGQVSVDGSTGLVTAAGGASMAAVYAALEPQGVAFALGNGASVGIGGLTLGGGSAATSRKFGLTADALVSTTLVTADGELVTCDAEHDADLFWACRGGGGGNFGINVSFTFRSFPVAGAATCLLLWDGADAPKVFAVLQEVMRQAPEECSIRLGLSTTGSGVTVSAVGMHLGSAAELRDLLDPVLAVARPLREDIADRTFWEAKDYLAHETSEGAFAARTNFAVDPLPPDAVAEVLAALARWPGGSNPDGGGFALFGWGGAVNKPAPADTAFPHRHANYLVSMDTSWGEQDGPDAVPVHLRWLAELRESVAPHMAEGAYVNFTDPDLPDWRTAYYGANYPRLVEVKRRVDPAGLFRFPQAVGS
ncbi:FAD-binding oxidoreductase [Actinacidiphila bryophytorum]|uniref:FAD-binding oxidoreductase n=1 Tax=Actinacidiphila bryophytorum TaxID=1436133 RepID=UPI0021769893|nr:FAD-binding oxidoreductase [Actinacidiphila bryophytorum]UWE13003.1 FAD-binding oxidoreductase [Actinacidiphila bryophytorum]